MLGTQALGVGRSDHACVCWPGLLDRSFSVFGAVCWGFSSQHSLMSCIGTRQASLLACTRRLRAGCAVLVHVARTVPFQRNRKDFATGPLLFILTPPKSQLPHARSCLAVAMTGICETSINAPKKNSAQYAFHVHHVFGSLLLHRSNKKKTIK